MVIGWKWSGKMFVSRTVKVNPERRTSDDAFAFHPIVHTLSDFFLARTGTYLRPEPEDMLEIRMTSENR